jgi:hypothetical protein
LGKAALTPRSKSSKEDAKYQFVVRSERSSIFGRAAPFFWKRKPDA